MSTAAPEIRRLTASDAAGSRELGREAFGGPRPAAHLAVPPFPGPGQSPWGAVQGGSLVAKAVGRRDLSWWHGRAVETCGIAGVAVAAEHRGRGLLAGLLREVLDEQRAPLSTLFPTAPGIYRRLGWEVVGSMDHVELPTAALGVVSAPHGVTLRRARVEDLDAVAVAYSAWARTRNGPLTRTSACFTTDPADRLAELSGLTLAEDEDGALVGYAAWRRGSGYGPEARLDVEDLVVSTPDAARALWRMLGSFASVTGTVRLRCSADHPARLVLPTGAWTVVSQQPYMLRVDPSALSGLDTSGLLGRGDVELAFRVVGDPLGLLDGAVVVSLGHGVATWRHTEDDPSLPTLTPQGLALAYAGTLPAGQVRSAGHLSGGDPVFEATLDALLRRRTPAVLDYF